MKIFYISVLQLVFVAFIFGQLDVPFVHQRVNDYTSTLSSDEGNELENILAQFERETSNQVVVIMMPSLQGEALEDYTLRVAEKNKLGKKGRDNGVLLFIAKEDKLMRIEVGYGLEGALNDATSDQIIRHVIRPRFRDGDFYGGIKEGVGAIILATKGEFKGMNENKASKKIFPFIIVFLIIIGSIINRIFRGGNRHYVGSSGYSRSGGWWGGGGFGGGSSGGGGGGFSGGGGSFGGGGASGSW
jgi:uncharacterized protein